LQLVVFAWGNDARGDDGLGPLLLERMARAAWAGVQAIEDFQLQIEHALDLDGADLALFLDAGKDTPAPFAFAEIEPARDVSHTIGATITCGEMSFERSGTADSGTMGVSAAPPGTSTFAVTPVPARSAAMTAVAASSAPLEGP